MRRLPFAIAFAPLLAVTSCCTDPVDGSSYFCIGEMSVAQEVELGKMYAPNIVAQYDGEFAAGDSYAYLNDLILEMADHSIRADDFTWNFTILNSSMPNAFAVPGGYIYITRGLLAALETEGQFISVMGHELGHVEHRHSHRQMAKAQAGGVFVNILNSIGGGGDGEGGVPLVSTVGEFGTQLVLLKFSRDQELQADKRGVYYAATMGYDPMEAVKTFEYFERLEAQSGGGDIEWLRTHPVNQTRIDDIEAAVKAEYPDLVSRPQESFRPYKQGDHRFEDIVAWYRERQPTYDAYDQAIAQLSAALEANSEEQARASLAAFEDAADRIPDEALFHTGIGMAHYYLEEPQEAKQALARAIELDEASAARQKNFSPHYFMGVTQIELGDAHDAVNELNLATDLFPLNPAPFFQLGRAYELAEQKQKAVSAYQQVLELEGNPNGPLSQKAAERLEALGAGGGGGDGGRKKQSH